MVTHVLRYCMLCVTVWFVDTTIRNLDERVYRKLKARAALTGMTVGEAISDAIRAYLARPETLPRTGSLRDIVPQAYPEGNEQLSEQVDIVVYGRSPG